MTKRPSILLNLDGGEHDDELEELYTLADIVHVACGGHAGDDWSMTRVVGLCAASGTRIGAHPSYEDRAGFGRVAIDVEPEVLGRQVEAQCRALRSATESLSTWATITSAKLHGALYHAADRDPLIASACVAAIGRTFGRITIVGLPGGALAEQAARAGHPYLREAFADRGVRPDGSLIPRGEPGAVVSDPAVARTRTRELLAAGGIDTLCIHADTPSSLAIARAVREVLGARPR